MNHLIPVFMGSKDDMPVARKACEMLGSFGIPYSLEVISGEKSPSGRYFEDEGVPNGCLDRVLKYEKMKDKKKAYLAAIGKGNTMGPIMACFTPSPMVTLPKGSKNDFQEDKDEIGMDMWSSLRRASDAPMLTVLGNGSTAALYMAEIVGMDDAEIRWYLHKKKGMKQEGKDIFAIDLVFEFESYGAAKKVEEKIKSLDDTVFVKRSNLQEVIHNKGYAHTDGPVIVVSEMSNPKIKALAENTCSPIIVTLPYGDNEIKRLQDDGGKFLDSLDLELPVGLALSPGNAAIAALKMEGLRNGRVYENMKGYMKTVRDKYR